MLNKNYFIWGAIGLSLLINLIVLFFLFAPKTNLPKTELKESKASPSDKTNQGYQVYAFDLPKKVDFAGEPMPIEKSHIKENFENEFTLMLYLHAKTLMNYKRAQRWFPLIEPILKKNNVPDDFKYVAVIESNLMNMVSAKNAKGFWQFLEDTGEEFGLEVTDEVDERFDPIKATEAACKYLNNAYKKFGSWTSVAASYNMGVRGFLKEKDWQQSQGYYDTYLNEETGKYVYRAIAIKMIFSDPEKYGYKIGKENLLDTPTFKEVTINEPIPSVVDFAKKMGVSYDVIRFYNPWLIGKKLSNRSGKTYVIRIPDYELGGVPINLPKTNVQDTIAKNDSIK